VLPRFELMSTSRTPTEMISHVQFTYLSLFISCLSALPLSSRVASDVLSVVRIVPKLVSAHQGQQRRPKVSA
jgi:hypothetical protein